MATIKGNKESVKLARGEVDVESGKPDKNHPKRCSCGSSGIEVFDDDTDMVKCSDCGIIRHAGGATLRIFRDFELDGDWYCEVPENFAAEITIAKGKPPKKRSEREKKLAQVELTDNPKPNRGNPDAS